MSGKRVCGRGLLYRRDISEVLFYLDPRFRGDDSIENKRKGMTVQSVYKWNKVIDRRGTASVKWDRYRNTPVLPMWLADMDFMAPPEVLAALHRRVDHGVFGYTGPPDSLVETVLENLDRNFSWKVEGDWIVWLPGLVTGLNVACRSVGREGDGVMTTVPVYPPFLSAPGFSGRSLQTVPMKLDGSRWVFDFDALKDAVTDRTRLFILCSPHNPLGRVFSRQELETLTEICLAHDIVICSDEIHCGLVLDESCRHVPTASLNPEVASRTITLLAPSKTYNIPGLACSFAVIPHGELRRSFQKAAAGIVPHVNTLGYTAAEAAYRYGEPWRRSLIDYLRGNRDRTFSVIQGTRNLSTTPVEGTYLAWIDARALGMEPVPFFEKAGVGLSDGSDFGAEGFVRLNFGCPGKILDEALNRMVKALDTL